MINSVFVIVSLLCTIYTVNAAQPVVDPKTVLAHLETTVRFNCAAVHDEPVYWTTTPYGSSAIHDIYIGEKLLLDDYSTSGRFSVEIDSTLRRYDLVIRDLKLSDAGVYTCIDERGFGNRTHAELIVWDGLSCREDQRQDAYMGENVFKLDQDLIRFICILIYMGNIRPQIEWTVGEIKFSGTHGTESLVASSSLTMVATSKFDGHNVTCMATLRGHSAVVLWISGPLRIKYAALEMGSVRECPGMPNVLNCSPPCSYKLETVNRKQRCTVSYSNGTDVKQVYFCQGVVHSSDTGSSSWAVMMTLTVLSCSAVMVLALRKFIKKLRARRNTRQLSNEVANNPQQSDLPYKNQKVQEERTPALQKGQPKI